MKKLIFTLISIFAFQSLSAQYDLWDHRRDLLGNQKYLGLTRNERFDIQEFRISRQLEKWQDTTIEYCMERIPFGSNTLQNHEKFLITYDSQSREVDRITQFYQNNQWQNGRRTTPIFNTAGNVSALRRYLWDSSNNSFYVDEKDSMIYDANDFLISQIIYEFQNSSMQIEPVTKHDYTNDNMGNHIQEISYTWDTNNSVWTERYKYNYSYNADNKLTETIEYWWDSSLMDWEEKWRYTQSFSATGKPLEQIRYDIGMQLGGVFRDEYIYDSNDLLVEFNYYGGFSSLWVLELKEKFSYDANQQLTEIEFIAPIDRKAGKFTQRFDNSNEIVETILYAVSSIDSSYFLVEKSEYVYDGNGNLMEEMAYERDTTNATWDIESRTKVCDFTSSIEIGQVSPIQLFPNPTTGSIQLTQLVPQSLISIYNSVGQRLFERQVMQEEVEIDLSDFATQGLYFVQVKQGEEQKTFRVIYR